MFLFAATLTRYYRIRSVLRRHQIGRRYWPFTAALTNEAVQGENRMLNQLAASTARGASQQTGIEQEARDQPGKGGRNVVEAGPD